MSSTRFEYIKIYKQNICNTCRSKYCKHEIHVTKENGITTVRCDEYNVIRKDQLRKREANSLK